MAISPCFQFSLDSALLRALEGEVLRRVRKNVLGRGWAGTPSLFTTAATDTIVTTIGPLSCFLIIFLFSFKFLKSY